MRTVLVIAAVALLYAAGPADAKPRLRAGAQACAVKASPAHGARAGRPVASRRGATRRRAALRRRALLRRRCAAAGRTRIGEATAGRAGLPGALVAPPAFATEPIAGAPDGPAPGATAPTPADPAGSAPPPVYSNPRAVQVRAYEFRFQLSKSTVSAGSVSVEFNLSAAEDPHDLWLVREDGTGPAHSFGETPAGAVARNSFALTTGRWTLFCSLTGHQAAGMRSTLTVD